MLLSEEIQQMFFLFLIWTNPILALELYIMRQIDNNKNAYIYMYKYNEQQQKLKVNIFQYQ